MKKSHLMRAVNSSYRKLCQYLPGTHSTDRVLAWAAVPDQPQTSPLAYVEQAAMALAHRDYVAYRVTVNVGKCDPERIVAMFWDTDVDTRTQWDIEEMQSVCCRQHIGSSAPRGKEEREDNSNVERKEMEEIPLGTEKKETAKPPGPSMYADPKVVEVTEHIYAKAGILWRYLGLQWRRFDPKLTCWYLVSESVNIPERFPCPPGANSLRGFLGVYARRDPSGASVLTVVIEFRPGPLGALLLGPFPTLLAQRIIHMYRIADDNARWNQIYGQKK